MLGEEDNEWTYEWRWYGMVELTEWHLREPTDRTIWITWLRFLWIHRHRLLRPLGLFQAGEANAIRKKRLLPEARVVKK